ncbi:hypothetical protein [Polaromonas sp.]|uniref:hypothetical protein n=1 Tax=Polaromonas sp. TaxID=1869339 RepID=UPI0013BD0192|nr:hypothetical protein [Polaromonas sp.]NDP63865.1 hypothetical protein [Polaromonas sp.]
MLKFALLGACPVQLSELAAALNQAVKALEGQIMLVTACTADALPAGLSDFDLVLLSGLEAPFFVLRKTGPDPAPAPDQEAVDRSIRTALAETAVSYRVLYGTAGERLAHAQQAVESLLPAASRPRQASLTGGLKKQPWVWMCDKCSDPQCEHRLLTALLARRDSVASTPEQQSRLY